MRVAQYVYIIDQAQGQDGWILAEFSFCVMFLFSCGFDVSQPRFDIKSTFKPLAQSRGRKNCFSVSGTTASIRNKDNAYDENVSKTWQSVISNWQKMCAMFRWDNDARTSYDGTRAWNVYKCCMVTGEWTSGMISESPRTLTLVLFSLSFLPVAMQLSSIKDTIHKMPCIKKE